METILAAMIIACSNLVANPIKTPADYSEMKTQCIIRVSECGRKAVNRGSISVVLLCAKEVHL
jgi:hypothetical protein